MTDRRRRLLLTLALLLLAGLSFRPAARDGGAAGRAPAPRGDDASSAATAPPGADSAIADREGSCLRRAFSVTQDEPADVVELSSPGSSRVSASSSIPPGENAIFANGHRYGVIRNAVTVAQYGAEVVEDFPREELEE